MVGALLRFAGSFQLAFMPMNWVKGEAEVVESEGERGRLLMTQANRELTERRSFAFPP